VLGLDPSFILLNISIRKKKHSCIHMKCTIIKLVIQLTTKSVTSLSYKIITIKLLLTKEKKNVLSRYRYYIRG